MGCWFELMKGPMFSNLEGTNVEESQRRPFFWSRERKNAPKSRHGLEVVQLEDDGLRSVRVLDVVPARVGDTLRGGE